MNKVTYLSERPEAARLNDLLDKCFGPGRLARTAERLREGNRPIDSYAMSALDDGQLVGTVDYWPVQIEAQSGLLLGPLAVHPSVQGQGVGVQLMQKSLARIDTARFGFVLLVGDLPYYERVGFGVAPPGVTMPGPVDPNRLLLRGEAAFCAGLAGLVRPAPELC